MRVVSTFAAFFQYYLSHYTHKSSPPLIRRLAALFAIVITTILLRRIYLVR